VLLLFSDIDSTTLKLEGKIDILKMYLHTENKAASLRYTKLTPLNWTQIRNYVLRSKIKVKMSKAPNYFERHCKQIFRSSDSNFRPVVFHCRDLDLEPIILKLNHDLDILKMYLRTEKEVSGLIYSKGMA